MNARSHLALVLGLFGLAGCAPESASSLDGHVAEAEDAISRSDWSGGGVHGGILKMAAFHYGEGKKMKVVPTVAEAVQHAHDFDMILARTTQYPADRMAAMRAVNPKIRVYGYANHAEAQKSEGPNTGAHPKAAYVKIAAHVGPADNGDQHHAFDTYYLRVGAQDFGNWQMDPANATWRADRADVAGQIVGGGGPGVVGGYDGVFGDIWGASPLRPGRNYAASADGAKLDPQPTKPSDLDVMGAGYSWPTWVSALGGLGDAVRAEMGPGKGLFVNAFADGDAYFHGDYDLRLVWQHVDGGLAEIWMREARDTPILQFRPEAKWKNDVDMLRDAGERAGKTLIVSVKMWTAATDAELERVHRYSLASFLLGTDGKQYLAISYGDRDPANLGSCDYQPHSDDWNAAGQIGLPAAARPAPRRGSYYEIIDAPVKGSTTTKAHLYQRAFQKGLVVVNPTAEDLVLTAPGYKTKDLDGTVRAAGVKVTIPANTGWVFRKVP